MMARILGTKYSWIVSLNLKASVLRWIRHKLRLAFLLDSLLVHINWRALAVIQRRGLLAEKFNSNTSSSSTKGQEFRTTFRIHDPISLIKWHLKKQCFSVASWSMQPWRQDDAIFPKVFESLSSVVRRSCSSFQMNVVVVLDKKEHRALLHTVFQSTSGDSLSTLHGLYDWIPSSFISFSKSWSIKYWYHFFVVIFMISMPDVFALIIHW